MTSKKQSRRVHDDKSVFVEQWTTKKLKAEYVGLHGYIQDGCFGTKDELRGMAMEQALYERGICVETKEVVTFRKR